MTISIEFFRRIMLSEDKSIRRRLKAAEKLLAYEAPVEVTDEARAFLSVVVELTRSCRWMQRTCCERPWPAAGDAQTESGIHTRRWRKDCDAPDRLFGHRFCRQRWRFRQHARRRPEIDSSAADRTYRSRCPGLPEKGR